jgi:hypothetical protein
VLKDIHKKKTETISRLARDEIKIAWDLQDLKI